MSFIIMQLSLKYYSLDVTISFCKFWFENDSLTTIQISSLVRRLICFHSLNVHFFHYLILYGKIYRNITMPDHTKISGYTPEAFAKMLKSLQVGLSRHIAN